MSSAFPLIYLIAATFESKIVEEGFWNNGVWHWKILIGIDSMNLEETHQPKKL